AMSSSKAGSPEKLQDEDLADIKPLVEDRNFQFSLETKAFHYMISGIREHFENHTGLASKLGIVLANLDPTSKAYKETKSDDALRNALFDAVSKAVNDSRVETWRVVFSHQIFHLNSPYNMQEKDLAVIKPLVDDRIFQVSLEAKAFHYMISGIRVYFENHTGLASKLGIVLTNLDTTSKAYKETKSDDALRNALVDAVSKAAQDSTVETWRVVFSHRMIDLPKLFYWNFDHLSRTIPTQAHWA
ncbi:16237_t:CDS:2, partial [Acaulospora colombiana]